MEQPQKLFASWKLDDGENEILCEVFEGGYIDSAFFVSSAALYITQPNGRSTFICIDTTRWMMMSELTNRALDDIGKMLDIVRFHRH